MPKKKNPKHHGSLKAGPDLTTRTRKALEQRRFQAALELARELFRQDPSPANRGLLQQTHLSRAQELHDHRLDRDAAETLQAAVRVIGKDDAPWVQQVARELIRYGAVREALDLVRSHPDPTAATSLMPLAADAAVQRQAAGRALLPEASHADFDRVLQAFSQVAAGEDERARETLQAVGLRSPFLEWKVLLRGLQAYYQNEDARALENWQRLDPERLPARLAAPFRFRIDPAYRVAQPPEAQTALQKQADRLQNDSVVQELRVIQATLAGDESSGRAFRLAEGLLPTLRSHAPQLVPRLASCFFWTIVANGQPEDVPRYQRVFGAPADDPSFARMRALAMEQQHNLEEAHKAWKQFEQVVAENKNRAWPPEQVDRVRALVWYHMGKNAAAAIDPDMIPELPPFLRDHPNRPRPLSPSAETCFQNCLKFAPNLLEGHRALLEFYLERKQTAKAEKVSRQLLEHFPDHAATVEELGDLCMEQEKYTEGLEAFERAQRLNPLAAHLRAKRSNAHLFRARTFAEAGQFDEARADYQASINLGDPRQQASPLCKWSACEFKADNPARAEELLAQARAEVGSQVAIAFNMVIEAIRLKLPRPLKSRFDKELNEALQGPPTGTAAALVAQTAASHQLAGVKYHGQKTHEKKVLTYVAKAHHADFTESQLESLCHSLLALRSLKELRVFTKLGQRRFPNNPMFPYLEAESHILLGPQRCRAYEVQPLLEKARKLIEKLPRDGRLDALRETIQERERMIGSLNPFMDMFENFFGGMRDDEEDDDDEEDAWGW